jgi:hypothetical protein
VRDRDQILNSLERVYRSAFQAAEAREDGAAMEKLDLGYQRDQVHLEVLLDIRDLLLATPEEPSAEEKVGGLLDTAQKIKNLTRLR